MDDPAEPSREPDANNDTAPEYEFRELASSKNEIVLTHEGKQYRLIATKNGRLVLNR